MDDSGSPYSLTAQTGTMAAALAANSIVFAMQAIANDATTPNIRRGPLYIDALRVRFVAIVASVTALVAGRALQIFKGTGSHPLGGTALTPLAKRTLDAGGDSGLTTSPRIATTAGLTVVGFTRGSVPISSFDLAGSGAIGAVAETMWAWRVNAGPIILDPGELLVISNPAIFDAVLTWQLTVDVDYRRRDGM